MKKLLLSLAIVAFVGTAAVAQDQKAMKQNKTEWEAKVKADLKLTADQSQKWDAVTKEYDPKLEALSNDASLTKEAQKEKKMALKKEKQARLFEFLTPEQQTKYTELHEKKKTVAKPAGS
jgi:Spy/CpxP family protein refolding chaperone